VDVTVRVDLVLQTVLVGTQLNAEALYKRRRCAWGYTRLPPRSAAEPIYARVPIVFSRWFF
jgi:hypothetical protein